MPARVHVMLLAMVQAAHWRRASLPGLSWQARCVWAHPAWHPPRLTMPPALPVPPVLQEMQQYLHDLDVNEGLLQQLPVQVGAAPARPTPAWAVVVECCCLGVPCLLVLLAGWLLSCCKGCSSRVAPLRA